MERVNLSDTRIQNLKPAPKGRRYDLHDSEVKRVILADRMTASNGRFPTTIHRQGSEKGYFATLRKWLY